MPVLITENVLGRSPKATMLSAPETFSIYIAAGTIRLYRSQVFIGSPTNVQKGKSFFQHQGSNTTFIFRHCVFIDRVEFYANTYHTGCVALFYRCTFLSPSSYSSVFTSYATEATATFDHCVFDRRARKSTYTGRVPWVLNYDTITVQEGAIIDPTTYSTNSIDVGVYS